MRNTAGSAGAAGEAEGVPPSTLLPPPAPGSQPWVGPDAEPVDPFAALGPAAPGQGHAHGQGHGSGRKARTGPPPPRPKVYSALLLVLTGAVMSVVGTFLPWWDGAGYTRSGIRILFARTGHGYRTIHGPGYVVIALAAMCAVLGFIMFGIGRSLTLGILSIVSSGVGFLYSLACLGIVQDTRDVVGGGTISVGVPVAIVGAASSLVGSVMVMTRRRYPHEEPVK